MKAITLIAATAPFIAACSLTENLGGDLSGEEDVDAAPHAAVLGQPRWAIRLGGARSDEVTATVVDSNGDVFVAGWVTRGADLGDGPLDIAEVNDLSLNAGFVSKRSGQDGSLIWNRTLVSTYTATVVDVALMPDGGFVVTGGFSGRVDFGGTTRVTQQAIESSCFLARYDRDAQLLWVQTRDELTEVCSSAVTADSTGRIFVTTNQRVSPDNYDHDVGLAAFSPDGDPLWSHSFGRIEADEIAVAPNGDVLFGGYFHAPISLGGEPLQLCAWSCLGIARYQADGAHVWSRTLAGPSQHGVSLAFAGDTIYVGATLYAPLPLSPSISAQWATLYSLSGAGDDLWSQQALGHSTEIYGTAALPNGTVVTSGLINKNEPADFGSGPIAQGLSIVAYDPDGTPAEGRSYEGDGPHGSFAYELAATPSGGFVYAGTTDGVIDMGLGPVSRLYPAGPGPFDIDGVDIVVSLVDPVAP